jgi:hypothetical protein
MPHYDDFKPIQRVHAVLSLLCFAAVGPESDTHGVTFGIGAA